MFRYNPENETPMQIDSVDPTMNYRDYIETENRFAILEKVNKQNKEKLFTLSETDAKQRRKSYINQKDNNSPKTEKKK